MLHKLKTPKISVVIPVYNGEKYLSQTLDSLLRQSFKDFEVLCINDCSTDNSESILKHYAETDSRIRVYTTNVNQGIVPKVLKNYALPNLKGEYYTYSSQDDIFSEDYLKKLWCKAEESNADAILPDVVFFYENDRARGGVLTGFHGNRDVVLSNREAVIQSLDWNIPGGALWKASLVKEHGYSDFGTFADEYSVRIFFFHCNKVVFCDGIFYYRQDNPNAITKMPSPKLFDEPYTHFKLFEFLRENHFDSEIYTKELIKSLNGVIHKKLELLANKAKYTAIHQQEAEKKIIHCYKTITQSEIAVKIIRKQRGFKMRFKSFLTRYDYAFFDATCRLINYARLLRKWMS